MSFPRSVMLAHHIRFNHYPPPPNLDDVVKVCSMAIDAINAGEPTKVLCKVNGKPTTAAEVAETWHLNDPAFIN
jgi:hypothetical protein